MSKLINLFLLFILLLNGCKSKNGIHESKKITVAGSTTILPVSESWASAINQKSNLIVHVEGGGSTSGINLVKSDEINIGASSRNLSEKEKENLELIEIGHDALAIVVHPNNEVENISIQQLKDVFSGKIKNWKELGGNNRIIQVINRESGSGTRSTFEDLIMCPDKKVKCSEMTLSAIVLNSNSEVKRSINSIPDSIGYISFGFVDKNVKALSLNGVAPKEENIHNNTYPIFRSLFYLVKSDSLSKPVQEYLDFVLSIEGQQLLKKEGFLAIDKSSFSDK